MLQSALDLAPTPLLVAQTVRLRSSLYRSKRTRVSTSPLASQRFGCVTRLKRPDLSAVDDDDHAFVDRSNRKRPPGFPNGLSCLTAASHLNGRSQDVVSGG